MTKKIQLLIKAALSSGLLLQPALADDNWKIKADILGGYGNYSDSIFRDYTWSTGLFLAADYQDSIGFSFGYERAEVHFNFGIEHLSQDTYFMSARKYLDLDDFARITFRMDGYLINNNDPSRGTDNGGIIAPQISYLNADKSLYLDLGYAHSTYSEGLKIDQLTPTLGVGFNHNSDWLQLRGYFIFSSDELRTQGQKATYAVEVKYTHHFSPNIIRMSRLQITGLAGQRIFAVDSDTGTVYNLADTQEGTIGLTTAWDLSHDWELQLIGGVEFYENKFISNEYTNRYVLLNINKSW